MNNGKPRIYQAIEKRGKKKTNADKKKKNKTKKKKELHSSWHGFCINDIYSKTRYTLSKEIKNVFNRLRR